MDQHADQPRPLMCNGWLWQTALFQIRLEMRTGGLAEMIGDGVAVRVTAVIGERPLNTSRFGGLADVDLLDQRVGLFKTVLDDRGQRVKIGLADVDRAEQIDHTLRP